MRPSTKCSTSEARAILLQVAWFAYGRLCSLLHQLTTDAFLNSVVLR